MSVELRLLLVILVLGIGIGLFRGLDPRIQLWWVGGLLWIISLVMTVINARQASRPDPRFLSGRALGAIQLLIGLGFSALFAMGVPGFWVVLIGGCFFCGGVLVLWMDWNARRRCR